MAIYCREHLKDMEWKCWKKNFCYLKTYIVSWLESPFNIKAEFTEVGIFFLLQLFARDILSMKELEIEETKTT